jgi:N-acyl-D-aspartate/D-glutamate deacylase
MNRIRMIGDLCNRSVQIKEDRVTPDFIDVGQHDLRQTPRDDSHEYSLVEGNSNVVM